MGRSIGISNALVIHAVLKLGCILHMPAEWAECLDGFRGRDAWRSPATPRSRPRLDAVQARSEQSGREVRRDQAELRADEGQDEPQPHHHTHDALASSAQRHSNPDLMRALANRVGGEPSATNRRVNSKAPRRRAFIMTVVVGSVPLQSPDQPLCSKPGATSDADHTASKMRERMNGNFRYYLAEVGNQLVGLVGTRDNTHLHHLFVAEAFQRQGLGRRLWEHAAAECRKAGNPGVFTVNSSKNAVAAYERFGFSVAGPVQNVDDVLFVPMNYPRIGAMDQR